MYFVNRCDTQTDGYKYYGRQFDFPIFQLRYLYANRNTEN